MTKAKRKQSIAGMTLICHTESRSARAVPIITGTAAPVNVLGRDANIHAFKEFTFTLFSSIISLIFLQN
jgi:hypothetical protein